MPPRRWAAMFAGVTVVTWYPITPSSSLVEATSSTTKNYRIEPDGKATFAVVQAEDELAAIGMVLGAGWAGARSMTATSGPGISLMAEFAGLGYYAEMPGVIFDVQRVGPSTGLPTRTAQGDLLSAAFLSHGDTKHIVAVPGQRQGMLRVWRCGLRSGRAVADAGLRDVRSRSRHEQLDVGAVSVSRQADQPRQGADGRRPDRLGGFARYKDVDGDAIRTAPCRARHPKAAYFTRGSRPQREGASTPSGRTTTSATDGAAARASSRRRASMVPAPVIVQNGTLEGRLHRLRQLRLRGTREPRPAAARNTASRRTTCGSAPIRSPRGARLHRRARAHLRDRAEPRRADADLLKLDLPAEQVTKLRSIRHFNGLPIDARIITDELVSQEGI